MEQQPPQQQPQADSPQTDLPQTDPPQAFPPEKPKRLRKLLYTKGQKLTAIKLKHVVIIYTKDDDTHLYGLVKGRVTRIETLHRPLASLSALEDEGFFRIRIDTIINMDYFSALDLASRQVEFDVTLPHSVFVSCRMMDSFKAYLRQRLF